MNLARLKESVLGFLQVEFPGVDRHALLSNGTTTDSATKIESLFLIAANNARRHAELRHDWQAAEVTLEGVIPTDQSGLSWDEMTNEADEVTKLRHIRFVYIQDSEGAMFPVTVVKKSRAAKVRFDKKKVRTFLTNDDEVRPAKIVHWARKFYSDPANSTEPITLIVEGYGEMPDYTDDEDTDYFLQRGFNYMMWATICELNYLIQRFVFRQEGTLGPPTKERDEALEMLIRDDVYATEGGDWSDLDDE